MSSLMDPLACIKPHHLSLVDRVPNYGDKNSHEVMCLNTNQRVQDLVHYRIFVGFNKPSTYITHKREPKTSNPSTISSKTSCFIGIEFGDQGTLE